MRRRPVLHEAENESEAKTYEADATKFGLGDLTFLKISLSLIATQPHMKRQLSFMCRVARTHSRYWKLIKFNMRLRHFGHIQ